MSESSRPSQGSLADHPFAFLLASLRREGFTGVLQVASAPEREEPAAGTGEDDTGSSDPRNGVPVDSDETSPTREIHFASGHIAWAISTDREESLKAFLVRHGTVTAAQWEEAEDRARQESLRQALTSMGIIAPRELTRLEISRVEEIVSRLFAVAAGTFRIRERQLPPGTPDLAIDASALLINGVMETADRSFLEKATGSLDTVFALAGPSPDDALLERLTIRGEFQAILKHVDGVRSVGEICSLTSLPDHFVRCVFAALGLLGCVARAGAPRPARTAPAPPEPPHRPVPAAPEPEPAIVAHPAPAAVPLVEAAVPVLAGRADRPGAMTIHASKAADRGEDDGPSDDGPPDDGPPGDEPFSFARRDLEAAQESTPSIYDGQVPETSRGWFLVGGAMAVGLAAVFLILFSRDSGDAIDLGREAEQAALDQRGSDAVPPGALVSGPAVRSHGASAPAGTGRAQPGTADRPEPPPPTASTGLAPAPRTPILSSGTPAAGSTGRATRPAGGPGAALPASRDAATERPARLASAASAAGDWSIQLLLACEEATIDRAVRQSGQSREIFVLPVNHQGRSCHRIYWGRYADRADAESALQDVPLAYRTGGARPWVTRLPS